MRPDTSDAEAPAPGDRIVVRGGQYLSGRGTLVKRNGNRAYVVLHGPKMRAVRTLDGRWWAVHENSMLELTPVTPLTEYVTKDTE